MATERSLNDRIRGALLWTAAFSFACGIFLAATLGFGVFPPTRPTSVGIVPILGYSKMADYAGGVLFMTAVPLLTVLFHRLGGRLLAKELQLAPPSARMVVTAAATIPFFLSPIFHVTTGKVGWTLLLPPFAAWGAVRGLRLWRGTAWLRSAITRAERPYHTLVLTGATGWLLYRYIAAGRRIAHSPTLFLEVLFAAAFYAIFWSVAILAARLALLHVGADQLSAYRRIACATALLAFLPLVALADVPARHAVATVVTALLVVALVALRMKSPLSPDGAWRLAAYGLLPLLIYTISYASTAQLSQWIDLFHLGEAVGPASDYLRGKRPYLDVFPLHGMLHNGVLEAWLMELFGRSLDVAVARAAIVGALLSISLWYLGIAIFRSIPLALLVVAAGTWTTAENNRTMFEVAAAALLWVGLRSRSRGAAAAAGVVTGIALFFSYEIGLYSVGGAVLSLTGLAVLRRRIEWRGMSPGSAAIAFGAGVAAGAAPFLSYLAAQGAVGAFLETSFVTIPGIIDSTWALPFPDLVKQFRGNNLNMHTLAEFVLFEKFHLIVSPVVIAVAAAYLVVRVVRRRAGEEDVALLLLVAFAAIAQRTALGRAEFRHQYFAAFLIGPILIQLGIAFGRRLRAIWNGGGDGARAFVALALLALAPAVAVLFWIPDLVNARIDDLVAYQSRLLRTRHDERAAVVRDRIDAVSGYLRDHTRWHDPVYDFSNQPAFYFFADRRNPTRFYQVPIASPKEFQAETIEALERTRTPYVIRTAPERFDEFDGVPNALRAQAVSKYIDDFYVFDRSIRGVELWRRRERRAFPGAAAYTARLRMPLPSEVAATERKRMVFPVVGSTPGANGAYWVSDLTLNNSRRDPVTLSLRFVSGEIRVDRAVTIGPRQTFRWNDVVKNLFAVNEGIGSLWIVYRSGHAPVAIVKTSDVAHGGRASIEKPFTDEDIAAAGSEKRELTIVGIPARDTGRRLAFGIVNPGLVPARFRVSARTRTGTMAGRETEFRVAEDEVHIDRAIEASLGVELDETMSLRVVVEQGSGVAFASYVDASGGTEMIPAVPSQWP